MRRSSARNSSLSSRLQLSILPPMTAIQREQFPECDVAWPDGQVRSSKASSLLKTAATTRSHPAQTVVRDMCATVAWLVPSPLRTRSAVRSPKHRAYPLAHISSCSSQSWHFTSVHGSESDRHIFETPVSPADSACACLPYGV